MEQQGKRFSRIAQLVLGLLITSWLLYLVNTDVQQKEPKRIKYDLTIELHPLDYTEEDVYYLTEALYFEDALGSVECQEMIGHTIQNRVYSWKFPNKVKDVVWQPYQFSYTHDGKPEHMKMERSRKKLEEVAKSILGGYRVDTTEGSMYYYNPELANPPWKDSFEVVSKCGKHVFLKEKAERSWG